ncbi:MAG: AAA family ATPase, partial [Acidimicrobiales bacterium]
MGHAGPERDGTSTVLVVDRDGSLADTIRLVAATVVPHPEVEVVLSLAAADRLLARCDVLVAGPSAVEGGGLRHLGALHGLHPHAAVLLAVTDRPAGTLREIVRCGADDLLPLPSPDAELVLVLERALALAARRQLPPAGPGPGGTSRGRVVAVTSPTGGAGKTFLATNTALHLARRTGGRVVLVDLDLQFGEVRTALRVRAEASIVDALRAEAAGDDLAAALPEILVEHDGFAVLAAPKDPADADGVSGADVSRIIDTLRGLADTVVVDAPAGLGEHVLAVLDVADRVVAIATPDRPSLHNLASFRTALGRLGVEPGRVSLVLNKFEAGVGIDEAELAERFPAGFAATVPYAAEVLRSVNLGVPVIESRSATGAAVVGALQGLFPETAPRPDPAAAARTGP